MYLRPEQATRRRFASCRSLMRGRVRGSLEGGPRGRHRGSAEPRGRPAVRRRAPGSGAGDPVPGKVSAEAGSGREPPFCPFKNQRLQGQPRSKGALASPWLKCSAATLKATGSHLPAAPWEPTPIKITALETRWGSSVGSYKGVPRPVHRQAEKGVWTGTEQVCNGTRPLSTAPAGSVQVTVSDPFHVVILFQPVTLPCTYQVSSTLTAPIVTWKYKSFCRDRIADAFSPGSVDNQINAQVASANSGYNPYVTCDDSARTVRVVATKQGNTVTLSDYYQGRRITITGNADLVFDQTAWGDSGVYYCSVVSAQDLGGNNEAYAELIVLDWLFVVVVCLATLLFFLLLAVCWCQCCPHTCCCYVRCPCCPDRCCCPKALYVAGKAATSGAPSIYGPDTYAYFSPAKTPPPPAVIPMGPVYNGHPGDFDRSSSVGGHSSQVPLLRDTDSGVTSEVRSGYRIQASQQDDSMRVLYYMEKELANFDPSRHGAPNGRVERALSEITSLHEDDSRSQRFRGPALTPIREKEWDRRSPRSPRRWEQEPLAEQLGGAWGARRPRAHSVDALDDLSRPGSADSGRSPPSSRGRGRAYAPPRSRSRDDLYYPDDSRDFPRSWDPHYDESRSRGRPNGDSRAHYPRSRDPQEDGSRSSSRSGNPHYDRRVLEEALRRKGAGERRRTYREEEEGDYGPEPPPYTETDSQASRERRLKKNLALSRDSLVV